MIDTKQKILDTAENLFGAKGYDATSLRHIITEAGVNLAAIHYHFGSKEELLDQLIVRRAGPVNEKRIALLDQIEAEAGAVLTREQVVELADAVAASGGVASGIGTSRYGARLIVQADSREEAVAKATEEFTAAAATAGLPPGPVVRTEAVGEDEDEDREP